MSIIYRLLNALNVRAHALLDETVQYKQGDMGARLTFTVIVNDPTKTIEVKLHEITLSEK